MKALNLLAGLIRAHKPTMDPTYPLVPIANFLGCIFVLIPLSVILTYWHTGVCCFAAWISLFGFAQGVSAILWRKNVNDIAPAWCDNSKWADLSARRVITSRFSEPSEYGSERGSTFMRSRYYKATT